MTQALLIVDVQRSFNPPDSLIARIGRLLPLMPSVATVERHDEARVPFRRQLAWAPAADDESLIAADRICIKYGYSPPQDTLEHLRDLAVDRVLVCGLQADTCVLAAGFALFDAGLHAGTKCFMAHAGPSPHGPRRRTRPRPRAPLRS